MEKRTGGTELTGMTTQELVLELFETAYEAAGYIEETLNTNDIPLAFCNTVMNDLLELIKKIVAEACKAKELHTPNRIENIYEAVSDYLLLSKRFLEQGQADKARSRFTTQFLMLLDHLYNEIYAHLILLPMPNALQDYYDQEFARLDAYRTSERKDNGIYKYRVSIIVGAYNQLEYTKKCIESLFKYTPGYGTDWELILKSDGSTDGTNEYFESLNCEKTFLFRKNIRFSDPCIFAAEGRYTCYFSNDAIATEGWLDNLLACMESDENIGMITPACNSISNHQQISVPYGADLNAMQQFAKEYNKKPPMWREMVRLMMFVFVARTHVLRKVGWGDPGFYEGYFGDDNISIKIKRAGYRLVFVENTFVHHFGSVTFQKEVGTHKIYEGGAAFYRKFGFDSWEAAEIWLDVVNAIAINRDMTVLCVDTGLCGTGLLLKERLSLSGCKNSKVCLLLGDKKFLPYVDNGEYDVVKLKDEFYAAESMDCALILNLAYEGDEYRRRIREVVDTVKPGGKVYLQIPNASGYKTILSGMTQSNQFTLFSSSAAVKSRICTYQLMPFLEEIKRIGLEPKHVVMVSSQDKKKLQALLKALTPLVTTDKGQFEQFLATDFFVIEALKQEADSDYYEGYKGNKRG